MKRTKHFIYILTVIITAATTLLSACDNDDDIDAIFYGKTWYIVGGYINGQPFTSDDIKQLYPTGGASANQYVINFATQTFSGKLIAGSSFSGTWSADANSRKFTMNFTQTSNIFSNTLDKNIYEILSNATSYSGDENVMQINSSKGSYISFNSNR